MNIEGLISLDITGQIYMVNESMCIAYPVQIYGVLHLRYSVYCANFNRKRISDCLGIHVLNFIDDGDVVSRKKSSKKTSVRRWFNKWRRFAHPLEVRPIAYSDKNCHTVGVEMAFTLS